MPRWLAVLTYLTALTLLIGINFYIWTTLFFPIWVFMISAYILASLRFEQRGKLDQLGIDIGSFD